MNQGGGQNTSPARPEEREQTPIIPVTVSESWSPDDFETIPDLFDEEAEQGNNEASMGRGAPTPPEPIEMFPQARNYERAKETEIHERKEFGNLETQFAGKETKSGTPVPVKTKGFPEITGTGIIDKSIIPNPELIRTDRYQGAPDNWFGPETNYPRSANPMNLERRFTIPDKPVPKESTSVG